MKFYQIEVVENTGLDSCLEWEGFNYDEAIEAKKKAVLAFDRLSAYDKNHQTLECRVYDIEVSDHTDRDEIINAICDCAGYDIF